MNAYTKMTADWLREYGLTDPGEIRYCVNRISNATRGLSCVDNFRLSINGKQDEQYDEIRSHGCCGYHDDIIKLHSGTTVKFGFNFGH
jgi:hypothetical protein